MQRGIEVPKSKSQHLISDDLEKKHGEKLKKGRLRANGNAEFYEDEADDMDGERKIKEKR